MPICYLRDANIEPGDEVLIITGLTQTELLLRNYEVIKGKMEEILAAPRPLPVRLKELVQLALKNGGRDNITMVAVQRYPDEVPIPALKVLYERGRS